MKRIVLIGGGGHCRAAIDVIESGQQYAIAGIVQGPEGGTDSVLGYPVLGFDADLPRLLARDSLALITVGQIKSAHTRITLFAKIRELGNKLPVIVSPHAYVSPHASLDDGSLVLHGALVNAGAQVGYNAIINSLALLEHDVRIGNHCHVSTGARVNGGVIIEDQCFIGSGAILREGVLIGKGSVIGAGSVIVKNVAAGSTVTG